MAFAGAFMVVVGLFTLLIVRYVVGSLAGFDQFSVSHAGFVVLVYAPWCGHSRQLLPEVEKAAEPILDVKGEISWQERLQGASTRHPKLDQCSRVLAKLRGKRKERARQVFYHLLVNQLPVPEPETLERDLNRCILKVSSSLRKVA